ncbi:maleylpyruvate isomerase N-terminal domain-containing protein [Kitasatospora sp. NPDC015120]|uniref:maleylpyruvate isomerase N-terminal domain-containing protein n=1 Tax=Kitasatospora sp. NPDC015120 TaxID=3364023 RepID=UPI0036F49536
MEPRSRVELRGRPGGPRRDPHLPAAGRRGLIPGVVRPPASGRGRRRRAPVGLFGPSWAALRSAADGLAAEDFARPSGCAGRLVRDLVRHLAIAAADPRVSGRAYEGEPAGCSSRPCAVTRCAVPSARR